MSTPSTSLEHVYELEPRVKVARARAGVLLLIISDALAVIAIMAGAQYLRSLNTEGQYKVAGNYAPPFGWGLLIMIGLLLSGLAYYVWDRRASKAGETGQTLFFLLSLLIMLAAAVGETWIGATLRYGVPIQRLRECAFSDILVYSAPSLAGRHYRHSARRTHPAW